MNRPWPEILKILSTITTWSALRRKGTAWATTADLTRQEVEDEAQRQTPGIHPWAIEGAPVFTLKSGLELKP